MKTSIAKRDVLQRPQPDAVVMNGFLGKRFELSRVNRLQHQEEDHLLFPFQLHCPVGNNHPDRPHKEIIGDWQGEFMGTWLDAAVLTAWNTHDNVLRTKIDHMVSQWLETQQADGYLGTYNDDDRWKSWDIWIHAHDIIGLLSYYHYVGDQAILKAAVRAADCVLSEFGDGKRFVYPTGLHGGMASSAILEPMIWLYAETGEQRFLDFGKWLADVDWEHDGGSHLVSILWNNGNVADIAGGKGIEMLTNIAGVLELYRATGDERYKEAVLNGWQDIVAHQLYLTGTSSSGEYFSKARVLPNDGVYRVGETCVSMGWMYVNFSLGRLTGDARFFDMAEQTIYNHLLSAQSPDGVGWAYYVGLRDHKRYRWHTDPECCPSRGVRAIAQLPQHVYGLDQDGVRINLFELSTLEFSSPENHPVRLEMETRYPFEGDVRVTIHLDDPSQFTVQLRIPGWCTDWKIEINGDVQAIQPSEQGYVALTRSWHSGDQIRLQMDMPVRLAVDRMGNPGKVAVMRGPLVYAADSAFLPQNALMDDIALVAQKPDSFHVEEDETTGYGSILVPVQIAQNSIGQSIWREGLRYHDLGSSSEPPQHYELRLVPFFDAGNRDDDRYRDGIWYIGRDPVRRTTYQVWLPCTDAP